MKPKTSLKQIIIAYAPPVLWATIIFLFSSQSVLPGFEQSAYDFFLKKMAHIFVYFILYLLVFRAVKLTTSKDKIHTLALLPILICFLYATSDEIHQSFVPGRFATLRDIGFDMLGVSIGFLKKFDYI